MLPGAGQQAAMPAPGRYSIGGLISAASHLDQAVNIPVSCFSGIWPKGLMLDDGGYAELCRSTSPACNRTWFPIISQS